MAVERTDQESRIISCSSHLVIGTFSVPLGCPPKSKEQLCLEPGLEAEQALQYHRPAKKGGA